MTVAATAVMVLVVVRTVDSRGKEIFQPKNRVSRHQSLGHSPIVLTSVTCDSTILFWQEGMQL